MPRAVLLDADGTLVPSEEPAFDASAVVTRQFADRFGITGRFDAEHLRLTTTGRNFRTTAESLLAGAGVRAEPEELERWVQQERAEVSAHLARVLRPRTDVRTVLTALASRYLLAAVSSSALGRLDASFRAAGLDELIPPARRFSAEDSLPAPRSKPDPAVYRFALAHLQLESAQAVAVEDSPAGAASAVAAGITTIGLVQFVPLAERAQRDAELRDAGVVRVVADWTELGRLLVHSGPDVVDAATVGLNRDGGSTP